MRQFTSITTWQLSLHVTVSTEHKGIGFRSWHLHLIRIKIVLEPTLDHEAHAYRAALGNGTKAGDISCSFKLYEAQINW